MFDLLNGFSGGKRKTHRMAEAGGAYGAAASAPYDTCSTGFSAGTKLATNMGWRVVEAITVGDYVMTFDNDMQPVTAVTRGVFFVANDGDPLHAGLVHIPAGVLGNANAMELLPEQSVMIESDAAEELFGDPFTLLPAHALIGYRGITRAGSARPIEVITLHFDADQIVYSDGGGLVLCPAAVPGVVSVDFMSDNWAETPYPVLDKVRAEVLVEMLCCEDQKAMGQNDTACAAFAA